MPAGHIEIVDGKEYYKLDDGSLVSTRDRFCKTVPAVAAEVPRDEDVFDADSGAPNTAFIREHYRHEGRLSEDQLMRILDAGTAVLRAEPNVLHVDAPLVLVGDIHGQYYDLLKLFSVAGAEPPSQRFLFLGDYVDRGYFSLECYVYLLALKISNPGAVLMLRGNHECRHLTRHFTFQLECNHKYGPRVYDACMASFDALPLAAVVNKQFFCVHGGIGPGLRTPGDIDALDRFQEVPRSGLFCDLLWSDPTRDYGAEASSAHFVANETRGCSHRYSYAGVVDFLRRNNLLAVVRGHEAQDEGYRLYRSSRHASADDFPSLVTVFSAANYIDMYKNKGAVVRYDGAQLNIRQFAAAPHPYALPRFMNAFDWSFPFLSEKVAHMFAAMLHLPETLAGPIATLTDAERVVLREQAEALKRLQDEDALRRVEEERVSVELERARLEAERVALEARREALEGVSQQAALARVETALEDVAEALPTLETQATALTVLESAVSEAASSPDMSTKQAIATLVLGTVAVDAIEHEITAVGLMADAVAEVRDEREMVSEFNNAIDAPLTDAAEAPHLVVGQEELAAEVRSFGDAFKCDVANEHVPPVGAGRTTAMSPLNSPDAAVEPPSAHAL